MKGGTLYDWVTVCALVIAEEAEFLPGFERLQLLWTRHNNAVPQLA